MKQVAVLVGAGSIGLAIARRVGAGKHIVLANDEQKGPRGEGYRNMIGSMPARPIHYGRRLPHRRGMHGVVLLWRFAIS